MLIIVGGETMSLLSPSSTFLVGDEPDELGEGDPGGAIFGEGSQE